MPLPRREITASATDLQAAFERARRDLGVSPEFPPVVEQEAAAARPRLSAPDRTNIPFVTLDPPGSRDLDQAFHLERTGTGFRVWYAIADVASFVQTGDPVDAEAHERGATRYCPDVRCPLHPTVMSEGSASLLPGAERPASVWVVDLDGDGQILDVDLSRAMVRSGQQLDYPSFQQAYEKGDELAVLLADVGRRRQAIARSRGALHLALPEQHIERRDRGYELTYRHPLPVEDWNAELSLLTGEVAAAAMIKAGTGLLRTMPPPDPIVVARLRRTAKTLGVDWPENATPAEVLGTLEPKTAKECALITQSARLFRGAGYVAFDGPLPDGHEHSAIGGPYAHVTAPLRRLADRYASELALAAISGQPPPDWARAGTPAIPEVMAHAAATTGALERAMVDIVEVAALMPYVGEIVEGAVVDRRDHGQAVVQLRDPAVIATVPGLDAALGDDIRLRVVSADPQTARAEFKVA